jgi:hypothetical protein
MVRLCCCWCICPIADEKLLGILIALCMVHVHGDMQVVSATSYNGLSQLHSLESVTARVGALRCSTRSLRGSLTTLDNSDPRAAACHRLLASHQQQPLRLRCTVSIFKCMLRALKTMWLVQGQFAPRSARCLAVAPQLPCLSHSTLSNHSYKLADYHANSLGYRSIRVYAAAAKDSLRESNDSSSSAVPEAAAADTRLRIAQLLGIRLPSYCSGCGVKLQQTDPDGPG